MHALYQHIKPMGSVQLQHGLKRPQSRLHFIPWQPMGSGMPTHLGKASR